MPGLRGRLTALAAAAVALTCRSDPVERAEIAQVVVEPAAGDAFATFADAALTLDIRVDPAFSLDFTAALGDDPNVRVEGAPTRGALVDAEGVETPFDSLSLAAPDRVRASAPGLGPGTYRVVLEGGRDGRMQYRERLLVRARDAAGVALAVAGLPDLLLADACVPIEVGFVGPDGGAFVPPPTSGDETEVRVDLELEPPGGSDGDGLALTAASSCGPSGVERPSARLSDRNPVARWNVRGRAPGWAALGVTASWAESGGLVDVSPPSENRVRIQGRVAVAPEARVWSSEDPCLAVRWLRRNPQLDDAVQPGLDLGLVLIRDDGARLPARQFAAAGCTNGVDSARLEADRLFARTFIRTPALGDWTLDAEVLAPTDPADWVIEPGSIRVASDVAVSDVEVDAPSVVAWGVPTPVVVEAPSPTMCELTVESALGAPLIDRPRTVEVDGRALVWVVPSPRASSTEPAQAVFRCEEPGLRARATRVAASTCSGLALEAFSLRLDVASLAPTEADPDLEVSLAAGPSSAPSSVFYALGDLDEPDRFRLEAAGDVGAFTWRPPLDDELTTISAVVRDAFGCPVVLEQIIYDGAPSARVVDVGPGALHEQLEAQGVNLGDPTPLVLVFDPETRINTVFADGAALGRTRAELVLLGPGSPALLSLTGDWRLDGDAVWSWIDLHGTGKVSAASGRFQFRDSVLREGAGLDLFDAAAHLGPGAVVRARRSGAIAMTDGLIERSQIAGVAGSELGPLVSLGGSLRVVQTAVVDLNRPLVAAAFDETPIDLDLELSTLHRTAPFGVLSGDSSATFTGVLLSRPPDRFVPALAARSVTVRASALVGYDGDAPLPCQSADLECRADDLFLDPTRPEWLSYVWCDDVDPALSDWDATGLGDLEGAARFFGRGYDVGHLEHPVSVPGACR